MSSPPQPEPLASSFSLRGFRHVAEQASWAGVIEMVGMALRYLVALVIARVAGVGGLGLYVLTIAIATAAGIVARFGLDPASMRFVAYHRAKNEPGAAIGMLRFASLLAAVGGTLVGAALWLLAPTLQAIWTETRLADTIRIVAWAIPFIALGEVWRFSLRGFRDVRLAAFLERIVIPGVTIVTALVAALAVHRVEVIVTGASIAYATSALAAGVALLRTARNSAAAPMYRPAEWLRFAIPMSMEAGLLFTLTWADQLIVGLLRDATDLGLYAAAIRLAMLVSFPLLAVNAIFAPTVAMLYGEREIDGLRKLYSRLTWGTGLFGVATAAALLATGNQILGLFGRGFESAYPVLAIIVVGQVVNAGTGSAGVVLGMTGQVRLRLANAVMTSALTISMCFALVPSLGIIGAAIATSSATAVINLLQVVEVRMRLGFWGYDPAQLAYWRTLLLQVPRRVRSYARK